MSIELSIKQGDEAFRWTHQGDQVVVGRSPGCQLVLQGPTSDVVSGRHLQFDVIDGGLRLADLNSSNGTFVRGERLIGSMMLRTGDRVLLGQQGPEVEVLRWSSPSAATAAAKLEPARPLAPSTATPAAEHVSILSPTGMVLVEMQKRQQRNFTYLGGGALVLLAVVAGGTMWNSAGSSSTTPTMQAPAPALEPAIAEAADPATDPALVESAREPKPEPASTPPSTQVLDLAALTERLAKCTPWVGVEMPGQDGGRAAQFPMCTVWPVTGGSVASTATRLGILAEGFLKAGDGSRLFVAYPTERGTFDLRYIKSVTVDPLWTTGEASKRMPFHNVAVAEVDGVLPTMLSAAPLVEVSRLVKEQGEIAVVAYAIPRSQQDPNKPALFDNQFVVPQLTLKKARIVGAGLLPTDAADKPWFEIDLVPSDDIDGAFAVGPSGDVLGIVGCVQEKSRVYVADLATALAK